MPLEAHRRDSRRAIPASDGRTRSQGADDDQAHAYQWGSGAADNDRWAPEGPKTTRRVPGFWRARYAGAASGNPQRNRLELEWSSGAALILATLTVGAMAGVMGLYANTIMPGLRRTDDRTFVGAFQAIDTAIINPLFLLTFLGGAVFTGIAATLHLGEDHRSVLAWIVAALHCTWR
jgi:hypothetical protein